MGELTPVFLVTVPSIVIMAVLGLRLPKETSETWNGIFMVILALGFLLAPVLWAVLAFRYLVWIAGVNRLLTYPLALLVTGFMYYGYAVLLPLFITEERLVIGWFAFSMMYWLLCPVLALISFVRMYGRT